MEWLRPLSPVVPVSFLIAIGFVFAQWKKISLAPLTEILVYLAAPALVFTSLISKPLFAADIATIFTGASGILGGVGSLVWLYSRLFRCYSRGFVLPVLFMNAGNIGLPLALFALGEPGLQRATLFFVTMSFFQYTLGVYILSGKGGWKESFRLPLIYAATLGLFFNVGKIPVPGPIFQGLQLLGYSTIPLMLLSLGYRLNDIHSITWGHSLSGAMIRILGGLASAYLTVTLLGIEGINRQVILLYGPLPSAVVNFVLTEKYRQDPELAASIILLTTLLSLITIPLVLLFVV